MLDSADLNSKLRDVVKSVLRKERYLEDRCDVIDDISVSSKMSGPLRLQNR